MRTPTRLRRVLLTALTLICFLSPAAAQLARKPAATSNKANVPAADNSIVALPAKSLTAPQAPQALAWSPVPPMQTSRYLLAAATLNNKLYAVGGVTSINGLGTLEIYDPATNAWTTGPSLPTPRYGIGAAVLNNKLYVVGGLAGTSTSKVVEIYDPTTNAWTTGPAMVNEHAYVGVAVLNNKLYAVGGYDINGLGNKAEVYNPVSDSWTAIAPLPTARYGSAAAALNGKLYAIGGSGSSNLSRVDIYDPTTNTWTSGPAMTTARYYLTAAVVNNKIYVPGGFNNGPLNTVEVFDLATNLWTPGPVMLMTRYGIGLAAINNKLYVAGGNVVSGRTSTTNTVEVLAQVVNAGDVLISEFRLSGPAGAQDEFVELYNNTDAPVTVDTTDGSAGWTLATATGGLLTIPNGTTIAARAHLLCANNTAGSGYSLNGIAPADLTYTTDIADGAGVALFNTANAANFALATRLDAVGSSTEANSLYREGNGSAPPSGLSSTYQASYVRNLATGLPKDTNDNAADFIMVEASGAGLGLDGRLGAPAPENAASPVQRNAQLKATLVDPQQATTAAPNRVRDTTSGGAGTPTEFGTLAIRRKFKNNTGVPVTALRFRVVQLTTNQPSAPVGTADLRLLGGTGSFIVSLTGGGTDTVQRLTLEQPSDATVGGGYNASVAAGTITIGSPLASGASLNVEFLLGVARGGTYSFFVNVEALP